ncbi:helix-turn-helix domain-containing protein [Enterococcus wangshanyuanii]|uniref:helix-turn-helix domain-containing protein n=1 Tax=Enterococcus wangshanyuanii TaxID=2005703 RepID=UPI000B4BBA8E|nr:helix-turn-helix domain-containing protein [Enterococcus wangshanyuanii]
MYRKRVPNDKKIEIVREIKEKKETSSSASKKYNISKSTINDWIRKYNSWGVEGLNAYSRSLKYSREVKLAAVEDFLYKGLNQIEVLRKYRITDTGVLRSWVSSYTSGKQFKQKRAGLSTMSKQTKTTYTQRIEIVQYVLSLDNDYQAAVKRYDVSYQQIYSWIQKYNRLGFDGLRDRRGKNKEKNEELTS